MLELLTWTATGIGAGWLIRTMMRTRRDFGLAGDLVTGWLGGIVGGWLLRQFHIAAADNLAGRVLVALVGAAALLTGLRVLRRAMSSAPAAVASVAAVPGDLEARLKKLGSLDRTILTGLINRERWARDPNQAFDAMTTFGERVADRVAKFGGSWTFIGLFGIAMVSWMALNQEMEQPFDPFPYILLNLVLSCLAALQAPVIMMSQNRQSARDRSDAKNDYEVNIRAEMEITAVHTKLDVLRGEEWTRLVQALESQQRVLETIQARLDAFDPTARRGE